MPEGPGRREGTIEAQASAPSNSAQDNSKVASISALAGRKKALLATFGMLDGSTRGKRSDVLLIAISRVS